MAELKDYASDYENQYKFVWGVKSNDDMHDCEASFYTLNDIEIIQEVGTGRYSLDIESIYCFDNEDGEVRYLQSLLSEFEKYMNEHQLQTNFMVHLNTMSCNNLFDASSIEELYIQFKIFVNGFCSQSEM